MVSPVITRRLGLAGNTAMKAPVTVVATSNVTQSGEQTIDGVALLAENAAGMPDRVLCTAQTDPSDNGIWDVQTSGWTRSADADGNGDLANGSQVAVARGSAAYQIWILTTTDPIDIGTTNQVWSQNLAAGFLATLAASGGAGLIGYSPTSSYASGVGQYLNYMFARSASEVTAGVTPTAYQYPVGDARRYGADPTGISDSTTAINNAMACALDAAILVAGTYKVDAVTGVTAKALIGVGSGLVTLKIAAGSTNNILNANTKNDFTLRGVTLDYTGGGAGTGEGAVFTSCARLRLIDVKVKATKGVGVRLTNCADFRLEGVHVDTATDWGMLWDGSGCTDGYASDLKFTSCTNRGLMMRTSVRCNVYGVDGKQNGATAIWMLDCTDCKAFGITDYLDTVGDSAVIEGASVGCLINGVTATTCGGHTASISASSTDAPVECHIVNVFSYGAGESMAAITDQGTGHQPVNCSIRNVSGRNCGRVTPSEGFGIANAIGCVIEGSITDTAGTMTYAVKESGGSPSYNRFIVWGWVSGSSGYVSMASSLSGVEIPRLRDTRKVMVDADLTISVGADGRNVFANTVLTAARDLNLPKTWPGDRFRVYRFAGGAFNLLVKDAGSTIATLTGADTWADLWFDGANWNKQGS